MRRWSFAGLLGLSIIVGACRPAASGAGSTKPGEGAKAQCSETRVSELRAADLDETERLRQLDELCGQGCTSTCLEYARRSGWSESIAHVERACEAGDAGACVIAKLPEGAAELCESGEWIGCSAALSQPDDSGPGWTQLEQHAAAACEALDARGCTVAAWARCGGQDSCDADASALAARAVELGAPTGAAEALAAIQCSSGDAGAADATLAASCAAGSSPDCERSCRSFGPFGVLARAGQEERVDEIGLRLHLQGERGAGWPVLASVMNDEQLAHLAELLEAFTPPYTETSAKVKVPEAVREAYPVLVEALLRSPQVDAKKAKYWFGRLPDMKDEERKNLFESLRNQWWIIPGENSETPTGYLDTFAASLVR